MEELLADGTVSLVFKIVVVISGIFYSIFALVIVKQVNKMTETLKVGFEAPLKTFALIHFILSIGVLLVSLVIL